VKISKTTETASNVVFDSILEVHPGGGVVSVSDLTQSVLKAGTPVGKDANGLWHVEKTATMQADATNTATDYPVEKGHNFKVGDFITTGLLKKAYAITAITTTETDYDTLTVGTTLGVAISDGDIIIQATSATGSNASAYKYTPLGLVGQDYDVVTGDNLAVQIVVRGTVISAIAPPISSDIQTTLKVIRFV